MGAQEQFRTMDDAVRIDLTPWGYASGGHFFYCDVCLAMPYPKGNWPHLGHASSYRCIEHAIEARLRDIRSAEDQPAIHLTLEDITPVPPLPHTDGPSGSDWIISITLASIMAVLIYWLGIG